MEQRTDGLEAFARELAKFVDEHRLPHTYAEMAENYFLPLADWLLEKMNNSTRPTFVAGIYGAQGSGKSTLADLLSRCITAAGKTVLSLSIDDFYLTREERATLAGGISPLLATRGPPGTHDVELALETISRAKKLAEGESMTVPRFDKAIDDRVPESDYDQVIGPVDLVIFEGWCLGGSSIDPEQLVEPVNNLERDEDRDGSWRRFVNESIATYQPLFELIDSLIMIKTENFESVLRWRSVQEDKLRKSGQSAGCGIMTSAELERFVQLFERVSRNTERQVQRIADVLITQDEGHGVQSIDFR